MRNLSLAERLEANPSTGNAVYDCLETAVNEVLPGSDTHARYQGIGSVGLAALVARDAGDLCLNPFNKTSTDNLSFMRTNRDLRPEAWESGPSDEDMLGGPVPEWLGRFGAFGLAKLNLLSRLDGLVYSHVLDTSILRPGEFGNAGGQRIKQSFLGISGLWEIHDHAIGMIFAHHANHQLGLRSEPHVSPDEMANQLESVFGDIKSLHGTPAAELSRAEIHEMMPVVSSQINKRFSRAA